MKLSYVSLLLSVMALWISFYTYETLHGQMVWQDSWTSQNCCSRETVVQFRADRPAVLFQKLMG